MILRILLYAAVALLAPALLPGVKVRSGKTALVIAIVFTLLNALLGPLVASLLALITLPAIVLTLGLFALLLPTLINATLLWLTSSLLDDFELDGCLPAMLMGFCFALVGLVTGGYSH